MYYLRMEELDIHPRIISAMRKAKISDYGQVLSMSIPDLERAAQLSALDIIILQKSVALAVKKLPVVTGLQLFKEECPEQLKVSRLSLGCTVLDGFLRGGILSKGITEIAGESASGKTQICMQLCLTAQLPKHKGGLESGAMYICTEDVFPNRRLMQMVHHFSRQNQLTPNNKLADNIFIEHAADLNDLSFCLRRKVPVLLSQGRVRLIIIDSIASLFRSEFSVRDAAKRAKELSSYGAHLKQLSSQHNAFIVCVNQVSAAMNSGLSTMSSSAKVTPSLGISWANLVTTRLMVSRTTQSVGARKRDGSSMEINVRTLEVMFSPHLPNSVCYYVIDEKGVKGLS